MNQITEQPAQQQDPDIQERIEGFNKELLPLLGKFELGLAALPKILGDGRIAADPVIVSVRGRTDLPQNQPSNQPSGLSKVE